MPRYPACFSLCRLVTTAGRLCPQPVNLHQQKEKVVPDHLDHQRQRQKRENNPTTTSAAQRRKEGKVQVDVLVTDLPPHMNWRVEAVCPPSPLSVRQTVGLLLLLSPSSQSLATLSFVSRKRLWTIKPVIATIKEK